MRIGLRDIHPGQYLAEGTELTTLESVDAELVRLVEMRFFAGLSAREAAVVMDKQEGTVRGIQFRAIAALRRRLGREATDGAGAPDGRDRTR